jgi:hypothetical protein
VKRVAAAASVLLIVAAAVAVSAQDFFGRRPRFEPSGNVEYDGRLVFVRLRYVSGLGALSRRDGRTIIRRLTFI